MRNWNWRSIGIGIGVFLGVVLLSFLTISVFKHYTTPVVQETAPEQAVPVKSESFGSVQTVGVNSYGLLTAHVNSPGAGSLHWENSQGMVASDTITWEQPLVGDIELSPIGATSGLRPVLIPQAGGEPIKGKPIP
jgi:hypothetical protein